ncbi:hypothetical protein H5410_002496 [Solanum commersonii]|uniref:Uncharacterized protein n=1 Tax=Solanum commersonii TaxID=4109 RepID=A0A9J6B2F4_SOLCO|nr:hypothetical protein H5410_002496 [Solanum commersonii]
MEIHQEVMTTSFNKNELQGWNGEKVDDAIVAELWTRQDFRNTVPQISTLHKKRTTWCGRWISNVFSLSGLLTKI